MRTGADALVSGGARLQFSPQRINVGRGLLPLDSPVRTVIGLLDDRQNLQVRRIVTTAVAGNLDNLLVLGHMDTVTGDDLSATGTRVTRVRREQVTGTQDRSTSGSSGSSSSSSGNGSVIGGEYNSIM